MKYLTLNAKRKSTATMLRAVTMITLVASSAVSAQARGLDIGEPNVYQESAVAHEILTFRFNQEGIDDKSVSFLESQKQLEFRNSRLYGKSKTSAPQESNSFLYNKPYLSKAEYIKDTLGPTANFSPQFIAEVSSTSVMNAELDKFLPLDLRASAQRIQSASPVIAPTSNIEFKKNRYAKLKGPALYSKGASVALLP